MKTGIKVYNLYPKLVGEMGKWVKHFDRIKNMNFDWVYINPIHAPGFSGSDYSVKDFYLYHPLFVKGEFDFSNLEADKQIANEMFKSTCNSAKSKGLHMMMDLVINHTAIDSNLVKEHPEWFEKKEDGSIKNPGALDGTQWVEWGDLGQIDHLNSSDKDGLWEYWLDMILFYCDLGVEGFRCDAAYHIPSVLWKYLISKVKAKYPNVIFLAETLGCQTHELIEVSNAGFDYVMNSFKWWNLKDEWFMRLYKEWAGQYPSLTFPENHDTVRFATETNGNKNLAVMQYALSAYFCSSIATTMGYEYGFKRKIDVVQTNPSWWETETYDISDDISKINKTKSSYPVLLEDNIINIINMHNDNIFSFTKESLNKDEKVLIIANTNGTLWSEAYIEDVFSLMESSTVKDISHTHKMDSVEKSLHYNLAPGEVKLFYVKKG